MQRTLGFALCGARFTGDTGAVVPDDRRTCQVYNAKGSEVRARAGEGGQVGFGE